MMPKTNNRRLALGLCALAVLWAPCARAAAEPLAGEQDAPGPAHKARKPHGKPRTLEQLISRPAEIEEPPAMLQSKAAPADAPPCQSDPAELQILLALRERRLELDGRERTVQARESEFKQAQKKLDDRVEQLNQAVTKLEARMELGEPGRLAREARIKQLVDGLSTLSAKKAAPILSETEPALVAEIMQRLGSTRSAALLAVMPTAKAARVVNITGGPRQSNVRHAPPTVAGGAPSDAVGTAPAATSAASPPQDAAAEPAALEKKE